MNLLDRKPRRIVLYGHLREKFGREFRFAVETPEEAGRALCEMVPGFKSHIASNLRPGYRVIVGKDERSPETLAHPCGGEVIRIVPIVAGAEKSNLENVLIGAALIGLAAWNPMGWAAIGAKGAFGLSMMSGIGMSMVFGGVAAALTDASGPSARNGANSLDSYVFSGPTNTVGQGGPIPVVLGGPIRAGGPLISCGIVAEDYKKGGNIGQGAPDDIGTVGGNGRSLPYVWAVKAI